MAIDFSRLNPPQQEAVKHRDGPLLVLAGAGTGKTTVITFRVAYLLETGVRPENILAVTFTNKAANEMKERLYNMLPQLTPGQLAVSTFHAFCCRVLRRYIHKLGFQNKFGIADEDDSARVIKAILKDRHLLEGNLKLPAFINRISHAKNNLRTPEDLAQSSSARAQIIAPVYADYQKRLLELNLVDFDDLLMLTVRLWEEHPDVLKKYRERYRYLLVDEYQDTNQAQARLLYLLAGRRQNLCVVGDDDQAIYGWRGADVANILEFPETYPGTKIVKLEENYRSTKNILDAANSVIAYNQNRHGKELWSEHGPGEPPVLVETRDNEHEAEVVVKLLNHFHDELDFPYREMAVLLRVNHLSRPFEAGFRKDKIPYRLVGAQAFYDRREIKDAIAYLRLAANPANGLSLARILNVPARGIGARTLEKLRDHASRTGQSLLAALEDEACLNSLPRRAASAIQAFCANYREAVKPFAEPGQLYQHTVRYLERMGYLDGLEKIYKDQDEARERLANVHELLDTVKSFEERGTEPVSLLEFLEVNALADDSDRVDDTYEQDGQGVSLMTVHAAKGLEFALVIIIALEEKIFPHERSLNERDLDEERRLFYVAMTRAKKHLIFTRAECRMMFGKSQYNQTSRFAGEMPPELLRHGPPERLFLPGIPNEPAIPNEVQQGLAELHAKLQAKTNERPASSTEPRPASL